MGRYLAIRSYKKLHFFLPVSFALELLCFRGFLSGSVYLSDMSLVNLSSSSLFQEMLKPAQARKNIAQRVLSVHPEGHIKIRSPLTPLLKLFNQMLKLASALQCAQKAILEIRYPQKQRHCFLELLHRDHSAHQKQQQRRQTNQPTKQTNGSKPTDWKLELQFRGSGPMHPPDAQKCNLHCLKALSFQMQVFYTSKIKNHRFPKSAFLSSPKL